ncbi:hypothetical protein [Natrialba aegyptia]|uniref:hypothetical protein n=1 Tax=Natrialba aegyptia TaxID=129789 RepID=UPI00403B10FD
MTDQLEDKTEQCPDCKAPWEDHEEGFCPHEIETGDRVMHSDLSGYSYRVTKWVPRGEGKFIALQKKRIGRGQDRDTERGDA